MIKNVLRFLAVLPASALAYCLGGIITLVITRIVFYDEEGGLLYSTNPEQSGLSWFELFFGSIIINLGASISAIMTADFVAPKYKLFCRCIVCGLCFLCAIYFAITLASTAATIGLIISSVMAVMNVIYSE